MRPEQAIGELIKQRREEMHMKQGEFAELVREIAGKVKTGFSQTQLSEIERGVFMARFTTLCAIGEAIGTAPGELWDVCLQAKNRLE